MHSKVATLETLNDRDGRIPPPALPALADLKQALMANGPLIDRAGLQFLQRLPWLKVLKE